MTLPSINIIRQTLANIEGALIDEPRTSTVLPGDLPHIPIHRPTDRGRESMIPEPDSANPLRGDGPHPEVSPDEEAPLIFEIPPDLDDRVVKEALARHGGRDFERMIQLSGIDAFGWYLPFHYNIAQHGIYISSKGVLGLAVRHFKQKYSEDLTEDISKKIHYASHAILRHEAFHFAVECMAANWELAIGAPCYVKASRELQNREGYIEKEEALANAYMLRGFRWANAATYGARATTVVKAFTKIQPAGYNRGGNYVPSERYGAGCRELAFDYHERMSVDWFAPRFSFDSLGLYSDVSRIDWRRCPIILLDEDGLFGALGIVPRFIACVQVISESSMFQKQLDRLGNRYEKKWRETKAKLKLSTGNPGLDLNDGLRVAKDGFRFASTVPCGPISSMMRRLTDGPRRRLGGMMT